MWGRHPLERGGLRNLLVRLGQPVPLIANRLSAAGETTPPRPRAVLLGLLLVACLAPRLAMAVKLKVICPDALVYLQRAQALDRGDTAAGFDHLRVNTLPLALVALHRLGFEWELAGKLWGVAMSTLAVLPLFGWTRRQFNDRIGVVACLLYAIHPGLIERSPEIIREPTFWFCALAALYHGWRAASEARLLHYLMAGGAILLSILTRFEGAFLAIPLLGWTVIRCLQAQSPRGRLCAGAALALGGLPVLALIAAELLVPHAGVASLVRVDPLARASLWLQSWSSAGDSTTHRHTTARPANVEMPRPRFVAKYVVGIARGFDPLMMLLLPASVLGWGSLWRRSDQLPLLLVAGAILFGAWVHLWYSHEISSRYALGAYLVLCPLCAMGLCWPAEARMRLQSGRLALDPWRRGAAFLAILASLAAAGCGDALGSNLHGREAQAELGRRIARRLPSAAHLAGTPRISGLVAYYAGCELQHLVPTEPVGKRLESIADSHPDAVLLDCRDAELCDQVIEHQAQLGLRLAPVQFFPPRYADHALLFLRDTETAIELTRAATMDGVEP